MNGSRTNPYDDQRNETMMHHSSLNNHRSRAPTTTNDTLHFWSDVFKRLPSVRNQRQNKHLRFGNDRMTLSQNPLYIHFFSLFFSLYIVVLNQINLHSFIFSSLNPPGYRTYENDTLKTTFIPSSETFLPIVNHLRNKQLRKDSPTLI